MRVLLVEDDPTTAKSIDMMLTHANLNVYTTDLGEEGIDLAKLYDYDLILLDLGLPDMNGHEVLRQLRLARIDTPILILSGADDTENKIKGFGFGADDYLTKPFHREELVARIHAIIRRSKGHSQSVIRTGRINVNLDAKTVDVEGRTVHLTGKEYQMLELLSLRKGTTLTKEMFLNHLYGARKLLIFLYICSYGWARFKGVSKFVFHSCSVLSASIPCARQKPEAQRPSSHRNEVRSCRRRRRGRIPKQAPRLNFAL
ncbi:two component transcriptional regulator, winged helix family protein [Roseobacter sp. AzwK-3b]|uniref:response regulator transcription factor n=1 Tax=Roseobacter sp. AzwK-3b TaxID=351016 RepID=UPI000156A3B6|nr:two component transcriptional regulator, winged helix family protein [Roseobacter sp. AzwK-3b]